MKKIVFIVIAFLALSVTAEAQRQKKQNRNQSERIQKNNRFKDYSPEEIAQLRTKKMTLDLNLNAKQQKEVYNLLLAETKERKQMMEELKAKKEAMKAQDKPNRKRLSKEERYQLDNKRLDQQIAHKKEMERILNKEQFEKWEKVSKMQKRKIASKGEQMKKSSVRQNRKKQNKY